jgi:hypothetical protein
VLLESYFLFVEAQAGEKEWSFRNEESRILFPILPCTSNETQSSKLKALLSNLKTEELLHGIQRLSGSYTYAVFCFGKSTPNIQTLAFALF